MSQVPAGALAEAVASFQRSREASSCTRATLRIYVYVLERFLRASGLQCIAEVTPEVI
jgi:hypothetical protein